MEKKTVLITGAASGIGKETAIVMAQAGYDVIINYIGSDEAAAEVQNQCTALGSDTKIYKADVSDFAAVEAMVSQIVTDYGHIDVLVNNAGITKDNLLLRMSEADFDAVISVNLKGSFNCLKHVSRVMMKQRSGSIINMSSVVGLSGNMGQANYSASKAGVVGLTKTAAKELASRGIRVNAVAPGYIDTAMTAVLPQEVKDKILSHIPLGSLGSANDVAQLVAFLASDASRYITGQVISVDGGLAM